MPLLLAVKYYLKTINIQLFTQSNLGVIMKHKLKSKVAVLPQKITKLATLAIFALTSFAANAESFNFSYSFGNTGNGSPLTVTGSFTGNESGLFVNNIGNLHVFLNGTEFSGPLFTAAWNTTTHQWDNTAAPVISFDSSKNNFIFADTNVPTDFNASNYFYMTNDASDPSGTPHEAFAINYNVSDANGNALSGDDAPTNQSWRLTVAAAVPEPESYALLLAGLALVGMRLRRK
jgi:hypothetical protein